MEHNRNLTYIMKRGVKRLIFSFFFLLFSLNINAQWGDDFNTGFESYDGTDTIFQKNQIIVRNEAKDTLEISEFIDGKKNGKQLLCWPSNNEKLIAYYKNGLVTGKVEHYKQLNYDPQKNYYLYGVQNYIDNPEKNISVLNGKQYGYYPNGELSYFDTYENGKRSGDSEAYYDNGQLKVKCRYENKRLVGRALTYSFNGTLLSDVNYIVYEIPKSVEDLIDKEIRNNTGKKILARGGRYFPIKPSVLDGHIKYYNEKGQPTADLHYKEGRKDGMCKEYYQFGEHLLKSEVVFKEGLEHGSFAYYDLFGNLMRKGIFYREIQVGDTVYKDVYDGRIVYNRKASDDKWIGHIETWKNFKKNGLFETYYYYKVKPGELRLGSKGYYIDNLSSDTFVRFDKEGNKTYQVNYEIVEIDGKRISQKTGLETTWKNGQVKSIIGWEHGKRNGYSKSYYDNGQLERIVHFTNGEQTETSKSYYENGQIHRDYTVIKLPKSDYSNLIGWNMIYDTTGNLIRKFYANREGKKLADYHFENRYQREISIDGILKIDFNSNKKIKNIQWFRELRFTFDYDSINNQKLRGIAFIDLDYNEIIADFNNNGLLINLKNIGGKSLKDKQLRMRAEKIATQNNPNWNNNDLVSQGFRDGVYQWNYANGSPFFKIEFKDSLPQGSWIIYNPISKDTLFYAEFNKGEPVGKWIRKRIGGNIILRQSYFLNHQRRNRYVYNKNGNIQAVTKYDSLGDQIYTSYYFSNGQLSSETNKSKGNSIRFKENGDTIYSDLWNVEHDSIKIYRKFYDGNLLKLDRRYSITSGFGMINAFYKNGQLEYTIKLKNGEHNGIYKKFSKRGKLRILGQYKEGRKDGEWIEYFFGRFTKEIHYKNGKVVEKSNVEEQK